MPKCPVCNGAGTYYYPPIGKNVKCNYCKGCGNLTTICRTCPICKGERKIAYKKCEYCGGIGIIVDTD